MRAGFFFDAHIFFLRYASLFRCHPLPCAHTVRARPRIHARSCSPGHFDALHAPVCTSMPYPLLDSFHFPLRPSTLAHAHRPLIPNHFHAFPCAHARRPFSTYCHPCPFACTVRALPRIHASSRPPVSIHPLPPTDCLDVLWLNNGLVPRVAWH